ncbi:porin family protein [Pseudozobellia thermophila]|uniref:Outer membrane protein beta-barrel domain-containing protein n=1 Tax=Pseudozobellia thermophila TaxID=192903 RepID=A0A1M6BZK5_9FLAO|nr:porin family protein [Pseudozobellia thermophila]SHI54215.1 Outer membrane protein beta-barrel domain-containing protein [Pseudozobellia thermophila]
MKKLVFIFTLMLSTYQVSAQDFGFGVKAGLNIANIGGSNYYGNLGSFGSKVSFHLGGVAEIPISEKMAIQPELLYSSQGTKWSYGSNGDNLTLDYVNLPILGKYYIIEGLSAEAGPLVGFLISDNVDDEDRFKKLDVAFAIGASYKLNANIFFSLRYNKGIANINGSDVSGSSQNNVVQISAGYAF